MAIGLTRKFDPATFAAIKSIEDETDHYQDALSSYLVKLTSASLSTQDNRLMNTLLYTIGDVERIADYAVTIAKAGKEISDKSIHFSQAAQQELAVLEKAVLDTLRRTVDAYAAGDLEQAMKVEPLEQVVDALVKEVKSRHIRRLRDGLCTVEYGFVLDDLLTAYERSADHCSNIAVEMLQVAEGKLEAHEYLNALKSGQLQESAKFSERFKTYRTRYTFPEEQSSETGK